jgi:hypothetical protein
MGGERYEADKPMTIISRGSNAFITVYSVLAVPNPTV